MIGDYYKCPSCDSTKNAHPVDTTQTEFVFYCANCDIGYTYPINEFDDDDW